MARKKVSERAPRRLWLPDLAPGENRVSDDAAHHVLNVLRLGPGDHLSLFDGAGNEAEAEITATDPRAGTFTAIAETPRSPPRPRLALCVALATPKGARADWAVEKLTEVGVARILWLECERSVVQPGSGRLDRWRRLTVAAAQQCGRADLPAVEGPVPFENALAGFDGPHRYIASGEGEGVAPQTADPSTEGVLLVGPEGGFARRELESAEKEGYTRINLGIWTLRVETAAVAGAAVLLGAMERGAR